MIDGEINLIEINGEFYDSYLIDTVTQAFTALTECHTMIGTDFATKIKEIVTSLLNFVKSVFELSERVIKIYPNKRVLYLALHSKKKRTRKKNVHRIIREMIANGSGENF